MFSYNDTVKEAFTWLSFIRNVCVYVCVRVCVCVPVNVCYLLAWVLPSSSASFWNKYDPGESITGTRGKMVCCFFDVSSSFWFSRFSWHSILTYPRNSLVQSTYIMPFGELEQCFSSCIHWSTTTGQWIRRIEVVSPLKD